MMQKCAIKFEYVTLPKGTSQYYHKLAVEDPIRLSISSIITIMISLTILLCTPNISLADNAAKLKAKQIKNDPTMIWAEREGADVIIARQLAETDLLHKIQVSITVSTSAKQEETIVGNNAEYTD